MSTTIAKWGTETLSTGSYPTETVPDFQTVETMPAVGEKLACEVVAYIMEVFVLFLLLLLGLTGNVLSCINFWASKGKNATSFLLIWLSVYDSGVLVLWGLLVSLPTFCNYTGKCEEFMRLRYAYLSTYLWPVGSFCHLASTWVVVVVTFHRFVAVCYPHNVGRFCNINVTRLQVALLTGGALLFCIPRWMDDVIVADERGVVSSRNELGSDPVFDAVYQVAAYYLVICILPFLSLLVMTFKLTHALGKARVRREQMTRAKRDDDDLTLTLVVVVIVFIICQTTNPVRRGLRTIYPGSQRGCGSVYAYFSSFSSVCVCFNSAINFILYCLFGRRFRSLLRQKLGCRTAGIEPTTEGVSLQNSAKPASSVQPIASLAVSSNILVSRPN